jgi:hypothetical protein
MPVSKQMVSTKSPGSKLVFALLVLFSLGIFLFAAIADSPISSDYAAFYAAGKMLTAGLGTKLYDWNFQRQMQLAFTPRTVPFIRPAFEALIFIPLSWLPYRMSYVVWRMLSVLLLVSSMLVLREAIRPLSLARRLSVVAVSLLPVLAVLVEGQDTMLFLLLVALAAQQLQQRNSNSAGLWLGLATFKFHLLIPLLIVFALRRCWRLLVSFSLTCSVLLLISVGVAGPHFVRDYLSLLRYCYKVDPIGTKYMINLNALLSSAPSWVGLVATLLVLAVSILAFRQAETGGADFGALLVIGVITAYHSWIIDLAVLAVASVLGLSPVCDDYGSHFQVGRLANTSKHA